MIKTSAKFNPHEIEKKIKNAVMNKLRQEPSVITRKYDEKVRCILDGFTDETGLIPEVKIHVENIDIGSDINGRIGMKIEVLNGDSNYKTRVINFIKSNM